MTTFDRRHKWGPPERDGVRLKRTCAACGRVFETEVFIPDSFVDALIETLRKPNPYRALFR